MLSKRGLIFAAAISLATPIISFADTAATCWPDTVSSFSGLNCDTPFVCIQPATTTCASSKYQRTYQCVSDFSTCKATPGAQTYALNSDAQKKLAAASSSLNGTAAAHANDNPAAGTTTTSTNGSTITVQPNGIITINTNGQQNQNGQQAQNGQPAQTGQPAQGGNRQPAGTPPGGGTSNQPAGSQGPNSYLPGRCTAGSDTADCNGSSNGSGTGGSTGGVSMPQGYTVSNVGSAAVSSGGGSGDDPSVPVSSPSLKNFDQPDQDSINSNDASVQRQDDTQLQNMKDDGDVSNNSNASGCDKSSALGLACQGTRSIVTAAQITNQVGQLGGSMVVGATGSDSTQEALANGGTTTDALLAAAQTQKTAAELQMGLGATNAALGIVQMMKASQATKNANALSSAVGKQTYQAQTGKVTTASTQFATPIENADNSGVATVSSDYQDAYQKQQQLYQADKSDLSQAQADQNAAQAAQDSRLMNLASAQEGDLTSTANKLMTKDGQAYASGAAAEQKNVADTASAGGLMSLVAAAQQLAEGAFNYAGAKQLESAALTLSDTNNGAAALTPPSSDNFPGGATGALGATTITGDGAAAQTAAAVGSSGSTDPGGDLGPPVPTTPLGGGVAPGGMPAPFTPATADSGTGGNGGAGVSGATTPAAAADTTQTNPTAAPNNSRTEYAGTDSRPSGNGGGGYSGAPSSGLDLDKIAGMFKKQEEEKTPTNANFRGEGMFRELASDSSVLGPEANLFRNVHERYGTIQSEWK